MHTEMAFDDADLNGLVDGRIDPSRAAALAESLASDSEAGARIDAWRRQNDSLRTMFASVLMEPVPVRLLPVAVPPRDAAMERRSDAGRPAGRLAGVVVTTSVGTALIGFALGALASAGTEGFGFAPSSPRGSGSAVAPPPADADARDLAVRAAEAHRTFLAGPSHLVEAMAGGRPKLARRIGRGPAAGLRAPDLARQGWSFLGGRVVPGRHGPAAFLAYGNGADRLGLTVSQGAPAGEGRVVTVSDEALPLGVATWNDGEFGYALTSDRGREWLGRNVAPLRDSVEAQARAAAGDTAPPDP